MSKLGGFGRGQRKDVGAGMAHMSISNGPSSANAASGGFRSEGSASSGFAGSNDTASGGFGGATSGGFGGGNAASSAGFGGGNAASSGGFGGGNAASSGGFGGGDSNRRPQGANPGEVEGLPSGNGEREPVTYIPEDIKIDELFEQHINAGINFSRYGELNSEVQGDVTAEQKQDMLMIKSFDQFGLPAQVLDNVKRMGYKEPTPIQKIAIPIVSRLHRDLMACAQTGSGKTAAFLLPMISHIMNEKANTKEESINMGTPYAIVIAPTRELSIQIANEAKKFTNGTTVGCVEVYGGVAVRHQANAVRRGSDIIVATCGRLKDFIEKQIIKLENLKFLVLDEADRMLDMGFIVEIEKICSYDGMPSKEDRRTLMFSATFPSEIQQLARAQMNNHVFVSIGRVGGANEDVVQEIIQCSKFEKKPKVVELLKKDMDGAFDEQSQRWTKKTLVFVETKKDADYIGAFIAQEKIPATTVHGDRLQEQREQALWQFRSGKFPVMIATNVAARGLDIQGVDHVIQCDLPSEIEDYVHRIGRTGRVGNPGRSTALYDNDKNSGLAAKIVQIMTDAQQIIPDWLLHMVGQGGGGGGGGWAAGTDFSSGGGAFGNAANDDDDWN